MTYFLDSLKYISVEVSRRGVQWQQGEVAEIPGKGSQGIQGGKARRQQGSWLGGGWPGVGGAGVYRKVR